MRLFTSFLMLALAAAPGWAATKMNVEDLRSLLIELRKESKSDSEVASRLKDVVLAEELSHSAEHSLLMYMPGDQSTEELFILQGKSAFLAPAAVDRVDAAAPDAATQKALLDKAQNFASKVYTQTPLVTSIRTSAHFQQEESNSSSSVGLIINVPYPYAHIADATEEQVELDHGQERVFDAKKESWGQNGQISDPVPLTPGTLVPEIVSVGAPTWERWQTVGGRRAAVFTFAVDKKKSHYKLNYCCFPKSTSASGVAAPGTFTPTVGEIQSVTSWSPYKKDVGYHGELFVDAEDGTLLRLITIAEPKPTDNVHQEAIRVDYSSVNIGAARYVLPLASFSMTEVVPGGTTDMRTYAVRHTLINRTYTRYKEGPAGK